MNLLLYVVEFFRFIKHWRERKAQREDALRAERREEREHQRLMLEAIFDKMVESQRVQNEGLMELAKAMLASSEVMATWLKGFQIANPDPEPPQVVRPEDEWAREQTRLRRMGIPEEAMDDMDLPPEFRLALQLQRQESPGVDVETLNQKTLDQEGFDREL